MFSVEIWRIGVGLAVISANPFPGWTLFSALVNSFSIFRFSAIVLLSDGQKRTRHVNTRITRVQHTTKTSGSYIYSYIHGQGIRLFSRTHVVSAAVFCGRGVSGQERRAVSPGDLSINSRAFNGDAPVSSDRETAAEGNLILEVRAPERVCARARVRACVRVRVSNEIFFFAAGRWLITVPWFGRPKINYYYRRHARFLTPRISCGTVRSCSAFRRPGETQPKPCHTVSSWNHFVVAVSM